MKHFISPTIESTDDEPKYYVYVPDGDGDIQAGEFHHHTIEIIAFSYTRKARHFKPWERNLAINYILEAYKARNSTGQKVIDRKQTTLLL